MNNWHVITGGPSTGKTTLLAELEKLGHHTLPEAARIVIDNAIAKGLTVEELRKDEKNFQHIILDHKVQTEKQYPADRLTFFDRGMHDTLAYLQLKAFEIEDHVLKAMERARYKKVFLLDPLESYEKDYARTESAEESLKLNQLLRDAFAHYGMKPIAVPVLPPAERAQFVLQHVN